MKNQRKVLSGKSKETILKFLPELEKFCQVELIDKEKAFETDFEFDEINNYFRSVALGAKPESALSELMHFILNDLFSFDSVPEVNFKNKFIDFLIIEKGISANPLLLELKPLFTFDSNKKNIRRQKIKFNDHENQIKNYLKNKNVEFVLLTNINESYLFNREAVLEFKPCASFSFIKILKEYLDNENLWDLIRREEDSVSKPDLDYEFYRSLKDWFAELANVKFHPPAGMTRNELAVLFLNKIIFIKTLEDHGLIAYKHLQETYEKSVNLWNPKGNEKIFNDYFKNTETFFNEYYNTELFNTNIWQYVDKSESNLLHFRKQFEKILGLDVYSATFQKGMIYYNYRQINEDVFGKAYETWVKEDRKDEGVYYTPVSLTEYMTKSITDILFSEKVKSIVNFLNNTNFAKAQEKFDELKKIKIIDTTSGSGSFLIKVLRKIYGYYGQLQKKLSWVDAHEDNLFDEKPPHYEKFIAFRKKNFLDPESELKLISSIIINHIFAADRDEKALDTAKTNLWKEAVKLNHGIYNYLKITGEMQHILPNLELNFIRGDSLVETPQERQIEILSEHFQDKIRRLHEIRNGYLTDPFNIELIEGAVSLKKEIRGKLAEELPGFERALYFCVEYFFCYFDEDGKPLPEQSRGFNGIVSNPPWEAIKPVRKEFAELNKYDMDILNFNKWFTKNLKDDEDFKKRWGEYTGFYKKYKEFLYEKYERQSKGDPNYYKFFIERDLGLLKNGGVMHLLVPSGFQTDQGSDLLRKLLIEDNTLTEIYSFENRGYYDKEKDERVKLFPDVDNRFKFSMVQAYKQKSELEHRDFDAKFYMQAPEDIENREIIKYNLQMIKEFSPENFSIMEFRTMKDYELCRKIKGERQFLKDIGIILRREFDMTNDANLFHTKKQIADNKNEYMPLYEGKMIHQYLSNGHEKRYYLKDEVRKILLDKELGRIRRKFGLKPEELEEIKNKDDILLDYQTYRFVYRAIGRSTDERTLISAIVPKNVFIGHSMNHVVNVFNKVENDIIIQNLLGYKEIIYLMALTNSLVLNYYIRSKVSANLTMNFVYELPIAEADSEQKEEIYRKAFSLLYRMSMGADFEGLKEETGVEPDMKTELIELRASLEKDIAGLYGLDKSDMEHICSTFVYGKGDSRKEIDDIIASTLEKMK